MQAYITREEKEKASSRTQIPKKGNHSRHDRNAAYTPSRHLFFLKLGGIGLSAQLITDAKNMMFMRNCDGGETFRPHVTISIKITT